MLACVAGRKIEFNPRALEPVRTPWPLRMSRRIGIHTIHAGGAKPKSLHQGIVNGGFETGDFTGWNAPFDVIDSSDPHSGLYDAGITYESYMNSNALATPIAVSSVQSFGLWYRCPLGPGYNLLQIGINYTDASTTVISNITVPDTNWHQYNLLSSLAAGAHFSYIYLQNIQLGQVTTVYIDDVSLLYLA